jgi:NAD(P)H-dependent flavin oxidoreductase YrpB (nitropropane dioxygenase family)
MQAKKGNLKRGFVFSGQNAYRVDRIVSVKELIDSLKQEFAEAQRTGIEDRRRTG